MRMNTTMVKVKGMGMFDFVDNFKRYRAVPLNQITKAQFEAYKKSLDIVTTADTISKGAKQAGLDKNVYYTIRTNYRDLLDVFR